MLRLVLHGLGTQRVTARVGAQVVAEWQVAEQGEFSLVIPASLIAQQVDELGGVLLDLELPNAKTPQSLGMNDDTRLLGVAVHSVTVVE